MSRPYRPSNGCEGLDFREEFCFRCARDKNEDCSILNATMVYMADDPNYPKEWVTDVRGPRCTAFEESVEGGPYGNAVVS